MILNEALTSIKGIGPSRAERLAALGLLSIRDLLYFAPAEYLDFSKSSRVSDIEHGDFAAIHLDSIGTPKFYRTQNRMIVTSVSVSDGFDSAQAVWFNQSYAVKLIPKQPGGYVLGRMDKQHGIRLINPVFSDTLPGILPVYPLVKGLNQNVLRKAVKSALKMCENAIPELLDVDIRIRHALMPINSAIKTLHFPQDTETLREAKRRLAFEDAMVFTIVLESIRAERRVANGIRFDTDGTMERFLVKLPFSPTDAQKRVMREIAEDMSSRVPMNRLIQGDVGSGKTLLALYAMFVAMENGYQSALMVPTEILAEQHFTQLQKIFGKSCALAVGNMGKRRGEAIASGLRDGSIAVVTGTHALIEDKLSFKRLGLVITDEQHRFGVRQRALLGKKGRTAERAGEAESDEALQPDTLIMSATPIPRTLSLILYGDLDVSIVDEMPPGRKPVVTRCVPLKKRIAMYQYVERQINELGIQAYVVCPMIEDNEEMKDTLSANSVYDELKSNLNVRVGLIHGKMKDTQKDEIMNAFRSKHIDILVSTTVIEVGVDVPNACIMIVESADRFGLAQLHQLRGRVGRGDKESYCFLLSTSQSKTAKERLKTLAATGDGFLIAEKDLETRGPGQFLGTRQHGMSEFSSTALAMDVRTLAEARDAAIELLNDPKKHGCEIIAYAKRKYDSIMENVVIN